MRRFLPLLAAVLLAASCARGTPNNPLLGAGQSPTAFPIPDYVGIGKYQQLAEVTMPQTFGGVPFVTFVEVQQAKMTSFINQDGPGFVYAYQGTHDFARNDGERVFVVEQGMAD